MLRTKSVHRCLIQYNTNYQELLISFGLTLFAGLSTGIGSAIVFFAKTTNEKFLSFSLGFSAGVMIYVSLIEIFQNARDALTGRAGRTFTYRKRIWTVTYYNI